MAIGLLLAGMAGIFQNAGRFVNVEGSAIKISKTRNSKSKEVGNRTPNKLRALGDSPEFGFRIYLDSISDFPFVPFPRGGVESEFRFFISSHCSIRSF
jgi:hypothetical protein